MTSKILIVDDHNIIRLAIRTIIESVPDFEIIGEASNGKEALEKITELKPDVVLLDISMPGMDGIEVTRLIREKQDKVKILILTMHDTGEIINKLLNSGADGYLLKDLKKDDLIKGIETVLNGEKYFSDAVSNILIDGYISTDSKADSERDETSSVNLHSILTKREIEIVHLIVKGFTSKEIGDVLFISQRTVETHRSNLLQKLKIKNTTELVKLAIAQGIGKND